MQQSNASSFNINQLGGATEFQAQVRAMLSRINTGELVEVTAVEATGVDPVGFVSVKFLTLRTNADNDNIEMGEVHNVPYFRITGGKNGIICDPQVGDIGYCGFCSRDISIVKRTRKQAATNVNRVSDVSDAFFFGGWSNYTLNQYVQFLENGINIKSTGDVNINGLTITAEGKLILTNGVVVDSHIHSQGNDSAGNSQVDTGIGHN